jgi:hypothetical protein
VADHPVKVPEDLVSQWWEEAVEARSEYWPAYVADRAAQWAADQELEACCNAVSQAYLEPWQLRAARRPLPPTLAERALKAVISGVDPAGKSGQVIIEALNRLAELEAQQ